METTPRPDERDPKREGETFRRVEPPADVTEAYRRASCYIRIDGSTTGAVYSRE